MFFPFRELALGQTPLKVELGSQEVTIHYRDDALTAWAENVEGDLLTTVLVYEDGWLDFFPESKILSH